MVIAIFFSVHRSGRYFFSSFYIFYFVPISGRYFLFQFLYFLSSPRIRALFFFSFYIFYPVPFEGRYFFLSLYIFLLVFIFFIQSHILPDIFFEILCINFSNRSVCHSSSIFLLKVLGSYCLRALCGQTTVLHEFHLYTDPSHRQKPSSISFKYVPSVQRLFAGQK